MYSKTIVCECAYSIEIEPRHVVFEGCSEAARHTTYLGDEHFKITIFAIINVINITDILQKQIQASLRR